MAFGGPAATLQVLAFGLTSEDLTEFKKNISCAYCFIARIGCEKQMLYF